MSLQVVPSTSSRRSLEEAAAAARGGGGGGGGGSGNVVRGACDYFGSNCSFEILDHNLLLFLVKNSMNFLRGATELLSGALKSGPAVCADIGKLQYDARAHA